MNDAGVVRIVQGAPAPPVRGRLFRKYAALFVTVVAVALLANGLLEIWFSYRDRQDALVRIQREQAEAAAAKIAQFFKEIESQLGWTTQLPWSSATFEQRRVDALRLLRQVPAITELAQLDAKGYEQLRVSRLAMDVTGSDADFSQDPKFTEAVAHKVYYGPVYFRRESEPYMTLSLAGTTRSVGISVAEVNLKFIWDVVSQIKVGEHGAALVVDADGRLIAHPDISLVLRNTDLSSLPQVRAALSGAGSEEASETRNLAGHRVLSAHALVPPLGWQVFVELPVAEAFAPLYDSIERSALLLLGGLTLALLAGLLLARRMVVPIERLRTGAARLGQGELGERIAIKTGDELETLADQFNDMAGKLQESYADLEKKVALRTHELSEALEQQTATAEVLRVINASPGELAQVFDTILDKAHSLCDVAYGSLHLYDGQVFRAVAAHGISQAFADRLREGYRPGPTHPARSLLDGARFAQITDCAEADDPIARSAFEISGIRTALFIPLWKDQAHLGQIVSGRREVRLFTEKEIAILERFAAQAVIAIENARLITETREALEQQTATAEVLQVINASPGDLAPVFEAMLEKATRVCSADAGVLCTYDGESFWPVAVHGFAGFPRDPIRAHPETGIGRLVGGEDVVHILDSAEGAAYGAGDPGRRAIVALGGARSQLAAALRKEGKLLGSFTIWRREVRPFSDKQIALSQNFAAQAVIAIENARLLRELRERSADLARSVDELTATSDVLKIISRSAVDLETVLDTLVETAARLCHADHAHMFRRRGERYHVVASFGASREFRAWLAQHPFEAGRGTATGRAVVEGRIIHVADVLADAEYIFPEEGRRLGNLRTNVAVPLLRGDTLIGVFTLVRTHVAPFSEKEIELLTTFADQAVIAIENARLFEELRDRSAELARSVDELTTLREVGQAVSSTLELGTVLETIVTRAVALAGADAGAIYRYRKSDRQFRLGTSCGLGDELTANVRGVSIREEETVSLRRAIAERAPTQISDLDKAPHLPLRDLMVSAGFRSVLIVPLIAADRVFGVLAIQKKTIGEFPEDTVKLMQTFASQSVLAIQNARLFREVEEQGHALAVASQHKSQFLANMSHELRTPLNAILGYAELLADGIYGDLSEKMRGVLERIQSNGKHLLGLINDVLDLSKIEAGQFTLALDDYSMPALVKSVIAATEPLASAKGLALTVTIADGLPLARGDERRLTQVLLNLVGNAIKFTDAGSVAIEAQAAEGRFTIAVADTGPGIAEADQGKIFEEFQQVDNTSTRKKGGTGLGLAIARRIMEMHGGTLTVTSALGLGSTFRIVLPVRVGETKEAA
jgi:signal transduction histidine kinase